VKEDANGGSRTSLIGVERTARILQAVEAAEKSNLADIARRTGLNEATVLRYLNSLAALGFIEREEPGLYRLGWEVFRLGQRALAGRVPREAIRPAMQALAAEFNETVNFALIRQNTVVIVDVLESSRAIRKINFIGQTDPWHASALGKALLATMPDDEWRKIVSANGFQKYTKHTITSLDAMAKDLRGIRRRGYALDLEEADEDLTCVAAAVPDASGKPSQYAISISFLTHRLKDQDLEDAGNRVSAAAREIAERLS
jgi:IclR family acetate operon transcriptional repressor